MSFKAHRGIEGQVRSSHSGEAIPGARITIDGIISEATTTKNGFFRKILLPGQYYVSAVAEGYRTERKASYSGHLVVI